MSEYASPEEFAVPTPCPKCGGKMTARHYKVVLNVLKHRSWICCIECGFEMTSDEFKEGLLTV